MRMKDTKQNPGVPIMDAEAIRRALRRIAHEIIEQNADLKSVVLAGIPLRGVEIARRLAEFIRDVAKVDIETGTIDVAMHRDDIGTRRELPIRADYVGKNLPTATREQIQVRLQNIDQEPDSVWLFK